MPFTSTPSSHLLGLLLDRLLLINSWQEPWFGSGELFSWYTKLEQARDNFREAENQCESAKEKEKEYRQKKRTP